MSIPYRKRENERHTAARLILREMARASCWEDVTVASSALFHINLLWKSYDDECRLHERQAEGCDAADAMEAKDGR